jgi:hypothetical protein
MDSKTDYYNNQDDEQVMYEKKIIFDFAETISEGLEWEAEETDDNERLTIISYKYKEPILFDNFDIDERNPHCIVAYNLENSVIFAFTLLCNDGYYFKKLQDKILYVKILNDNPDVLIVTQQSKLQLCIMLVDKNFFIFKEEKILNKYVITQNIECFQTDSTRFKDWLIIYDKDSGFNFSLHKVTNEIDISKMIRYIMSITLNASSQKVNMYYTQEEESFLLMDELDIDKSQPTKLSSVSLIQLQKMNENSELTIYDTTKLISIEMVANSHKSRVRLQLRERLDARILNEKYIGPYKPVNTNLSTTFICDDRKVLIVLCDHKNPYHRWMFFVDLDHFFMSSCWNFQLAEQNGTYKFTDKLSLDENDHKLKQKRNKDIVTAAQGKTYYNEILNKKYTVQSQKKHLDATERKKKLLHERNETKEKDKKKEKGHKKT